MTMKDVDKLYNKGKSAGFDVIDVREFVRRDGKRPTETWMKTPYTFEGQPVKGFMGIEPGSNKRTINHDDDYCSCEFYVGDRNIEDIVAENGSNYVMKTANGEDITYAQAKEQLVEFGRAANYYPHVFTKEEYMECQSDVNSRLGLDAPTDESYEKYLDSVESQLIDRIKFVGKISSVEDLDELNTMRPSYEAMLEEVFSNEDEQQFE